MCMPTPYWDELECGSDTPAAAQAYIVRPEQSNASGPAAPQLYGSPCWASATWTAFWAAEVVGPTATGTGCRVLLRLALVPDPLLSRSARSCTVSRCTKASSLTFFRPRSALLAAMSWVTFCCADSAAWARDWARMASVTRASLYCSATISACPPSCVNCSRASEEVCGAGGCGAALPVAGKTPRGVAARTSTVSSRGNQTANHGVATEAALLVFHATAYRVS